MPIQRSAPALRAAQERCLQLLLALFSYATHLFAAYERFVGAVAGAVAGSAEGAAKALARMPLTGQAPKPAEKQASTPGADARQDTSAPIVPTVTVTAKPTPVDRAVPVHTEVAARVFTAVPMAAPRAAPAPQPATAPEPSLDIPVVVKEELWEAPPTPEPSVRALPDKPRVAVTKLATKSVASPSGPPAIPATYGAPATAAECHLASFPVEFPSQPSSAASVPEAEELEVVLGEAGTLKAAATPEGLDKKKKKKRGPLRSALHKAKKELKKVVPLT